jgi:hypothetical protein
MTYLIIEELGTGELKQFELYSDEHLDYWMDQNEEHLLSMWEEYRFEHDIGQYDDVDFYDDGLFRDMASDLYVKEHEDLESTLSRTV